MIDVSVPVSENEIQLTHFVPGRIRFKLEKLKKDAGFADLVRQVLSKITGVMKVETNPVTGSVLVLYNPAKFRWDDPSIRVIAPGLFPDDLSPDMYEDWLRLRMTGRSQVDLKEQIESVAGGLNRRVVEATGGTADLSTVVPVALVAMGVGSIVVTRKLPLPKWYDFFWFALGTYAMFRGVSRTNP